MLGGPLSAYSRRRPGTRFGGKLGLFRRASSGPTVASLLAADGWQATVDDPTALSFPVAFPLGRAGFKDGVATTLPETGYITTRVRQVYPNEANWTADQVALNDPVMAADSASALGTNNSTLVSPTPVARWLMPDRLTVTSEVDWEIGAGHYFCRPDPSTGVGKQVDCAKVRANNGTQVTARQIDSDPATSTGLVDDTVPLELHGGTLDVSALDDGAFWLEGQVFPFVGVGESVLESEDESVFKQFSRRYFLKKAVIAHAFTASTGNDGTGVISTNEATAQGSPFLTPGGVLAATRTQLPTTTGAVDGLKIHVVDAVNLGTVSAGTVYQDVGAVIITRAAGTTRANANVTMNAHFSPRFTDTAATNAEGALIFHDITFTLGGAFVFQGTTVRHLHVQFWNVNLDYNSFAGVLRTSNQSHLSFFGCAMSNFVSGLSTGAAGDIRVLRSITGDFNATPIDGFCLAGGVLENCYIQQTNGEQGAFIYRPELPSTPSGQNSIYIRASASGADIGGVAIIEPLIPYIANTGNITIRLSADSDFGNITHAVLVHPTTPGQEGFGRWNIGYDDTIGVPRNHQFIRMIGCLGSSDNVKGDVFRSDGTKTGHFMRHHGVGMVGNFTRDGPAGGGDLSSGLLYPGLGSIIAGGDPIYVDYQAVIASGPTAGTIGGDYHLDTGVDARDIVPYPVMATDREGNSRGTGTQDAGAYA